MQRINSLRDVADRYDAFILDLWGVIHDGVAMYPHAKETLYALHNMGKKIIFLSNAPRRSEVVINGLSNFGVEREIYIDAVSSGEITREYLNTHRLGRQYVYTGLEKDRVLLNGMDYNETEDYAEADFVLNTGLDTFEQTLADKMPFLEEALAHNLPMLCANPDRIVVRQSGERILCAGVLADEYRYMGGRVKYIGKPYKEVYQACFSILKSSGITNEAQVLAVGDNLDTDIAGANRIGIDCLFLSGGILSTLEGEVPSDETVDEAVANAGVIPTYLTQHFDWK